MTELSDPFFVQDLILEDEIESEKGEEMAMTKELYEKKSQL